VGNSAGDGPFAFNSGVIGALLGNGDGTFQAPIVYSSGGFNTNGQIAVSDLNGDGLPDIVAPDSCNAIIPIYAGGNEYLRCEESDSPVGVLLQIPPDAKTSSTSMASSLNPWYYGAPLTLSATVTPTPGGKATGNVKFYDGWVKLGSSSLKDNVASLSGLAPAFGWHLFRAQYSGGDGVPASISAPLEEVSNQATTTTVVVASVNPSYVGQTVTYTAAVTGLYGGAVTGTVTFVQGLGKQAITLCSAVALVNGQAACDATYTAAGGYPITASYSGDPNNVHSTSARLSHDVRVLPAPTTTKVSTSGSPSLVNQDVTFTATVTSNLPIPDGETVTFYRGAIEIGTGTTSNGIAVLTSSFSYAHTYLIEAHYPGDTSHKRSLGSVQQVVSP